MVSRKTLEIGCGLGVRTCGWQSVQGRDILHISVMERWNGTERHRWGETETWKREAVSAGGFELIIIKVIPVHLSLV